MISHHGKRVNETGTISFGSHLARDHTLYVALRLGLVCMSTMYLLV